MIEATKTLHPSVPEQETIMTHPMSQPWLPEDELHTLQCAVEHLRAVAPDEGDMDGRARRADAAFRLASKLEQIVARQRG